jgi:hypothetical protein
VSNDLGVGGTANEEGEDLLGSGSEDRGPTVIWEPSFLGAIGHPDVEPGILEVGILLKTRFALDQYINLRPVKLYPNLETPLKDKGPEHVDFVAHPGAQVQRVHPLWEHKRIDGVFPVREPHPCRAVAPSRMPGRPSRGVVTA